MLVRRAANLNYSPLEFYRGEKKVIMKDIFASLSRLIVAYSKFGIMIFSLSLMNTTLKADQSFYYLATNSQFIKLGGVYVQETQNIRNKKLINQIIKNGRSI
jgi:hypothetical protein